MHNIWKNRKNNREENLLAPPSNKTPLRVGLTGGIGSGKSTAARHFAELGVSVIDADQIARELVTPGSPALAQISTHFGPTVVDKQGGLLRSKLQELIFTDADARQWLETLLHPLILQEIQRRSYATTSAYCIIVIPLLTEKKLPHTVDRVLVVDAPRALQIKRVQQRDQLETKQINAILQTQVTSEQRLAIADDILCNDGDLTKLRQQIERLHEKYLRLACHPYEHGNLG